MDDYTSQMEAWIGENLEDIIAEQMYTGFNPIQSRERILQSKTSKIKDIGIVLAFCIFRGTKILKAKKKMDQRGRDNLADALTNLGIDDRRSSKASIRADEMTVSRLSACFPDLSSMIMGKHAKKENDSSNLPVHLQFPQARSIIKSPELVKLWEEWSLAFTEKIKGNVEEQKHYWGVQAESKMFRDEERLKFEKEDWWVRKGTNNGSKGSEEDEVKKRTREEEEERMRIEKEKDDESNDEQSDEEEKQEDEEGMQETGGLQINKKPYLSQSSKREMNDITKNLHAMAHLSFTKTHRGKIEKEETMVLDISGESLEGVPGTDNRKRHLGLFYKKNGLIYEYLNENMVLTSFFYSVESSQWKIFKSSNFTDEYR